MSRRRLMSRRGGVYTPPAGGDVLATVVFENTHATVATPSESYVTFGMGFKKGDVPSGSRPRLERADTHAQIPAQFDLRTTWTDGSLMHCEVSCIAPSIAGAATLDVDISSESGAYDNSAARTLSDITSNSDFKFTLTSFQTFDATVINGGTSTADFNTASADSGKTDHIKSGPICDQWRTWMLFPGTSNVGAWFYVTVWTKDSDGTRGPISHISKVHNGFLNVAGATRFTYDMAYKDGGSTIRSRSSVNHWHHTDRWSCDDDGLSDWTANEATIFVKPDSAYLRTTRLIPSYDLSLDVVGPDTATPMSYGAEINTNGLYNEPLNAGGGSQMRGIMPQWDVRSLIKRDKGFQQTSRVNALIMSHLYMMWTNEATGRIPTLRGSNASGSSGDYTGLGTTQTTTHFFGSGNLNGTVLPTGGVGDWDTENPLDSSHQPHGVYYTALTEGGAHLIDIQLHLFNQLMFWRGDSAAPNAGYGGFTRGARVTGASTVYRGIGMHQGNSPRGDGWKMVGYGHTWALCPDDWPERQYVEDVVNLNATYVAEYLTTLAASDNIDPIGWWAAWNASTEHCLQFMHDIVIWGACTVWAISENDDWLTFIDSVKRLLVGFCDGSWGGSPLGASCFRVMCAVPDSTSVANWFDDWSEVYVELPGVVITGNASTNKFTRSTNAGAAVLTMAPLTNGDRVVVPTDLNAGSMPGNTSKNVFYWVVNVSGETFEVSTTEGGAGIDLSSDGTANLIAYWRPTWAGSPVWYTADPENYLPMGISALCLMEFLGVTGVSAARQALEPFQLADFEAGWFSSGTYSAPGFKMLPS